MKTEVDVIETEFPQIPMYVFSGSRPSSRVELKLAIRKLLKLEPVGYCKTWSLLCIS